MSFTGIYTALITPFRGEKLDVEALERLVERQVEAGIDGIVPCGTTGESSTLAASEKLEVFRVVIKAARGRLKVVAGVGTNDTAETVRLARAAHELGADGGMTITPYYNKPTQEGLYHHFRTVAESVKGWPFMLYNVPSRTSVSLTVETCDRLADVPGIVAIKEATANMVFDGELLARCGDRLTVLSGDDATALPLWALGAQGLVCVASNLVPERLVELWTAFGRGDLETARRLHLRLLPLFNGLFLETNPVPVKTLAAWSMGGFSPDVRLPLVPLGPSSIAALRALCQDQGIDLR